MKTDLLIDSDAFWTSLRRDIHSAHHRIFIQTLSFEGDQVGKMLSDLLLSSIPTDIKILVDDYTRWILSDKFLYTPKSLIDKELRSEVRETYQMIKHLEDHGIRVKFTNPVRRFVELFARNHKKIIVIDSDIAYIGGINFSEHNFAWHDLMLRIEDQEVAEFLAQDFLLTWSGSNNCAAKRCGDLALYSLDGKTNKEVFKKIIDLLEGARQSIFVESPYLSSPFYESLKRAKQKGVAVTIVTPKYNNYPILGKYTLYEARQANIEAYLYRNIMSHLKAILIDDHYLIIGSSNFDYLSYWLQQELIAIITDKQLITEFQERVVRQDLRNSDKFNGSISKLTGDILSFGLRSFGEFLVFINNIYSD